MTQPLHETFDSPVGELKATFGTGGGAVIICLCPGATCELRICSFIPPGVVGTGLGVVCAPPLKREPRYRAGGGGGGGVGWAVNLVWEIW